MVENHWLAVFIETCTLGLAVGFLRITRAKCYSLRLFVTNRTIARRSSIGRLRLCRGDWHSKIWQKIHWFIVFHLPILGDL